MAKVLIIKTSMMDKTKKGSISNCCLDKFVEIYKKNNLDDSFEVLDLNVDPVGRDVLLDFNFSKHWDDSDKYIDQLKSVNKLILASPMTNFNYPAVLKNYLDKVLLAGKSFKYKYDGKGESIGLIDNLKVQIITSQGAPKGWYPFGDHTISLKGTFEFMGTNVVEPLIIAGTKTKEYINLTKEEVVDKYIDDIEKAAKSF